MKPPPGALGLALVAGGMDLLTGLGLVGLPQLTLGLMSVPVPGAEALLYLRFVGAFVAATGAMYLWALSAPAARLRPVLGATLLPRGAAGCFTGLAVLSGALARPWLSVTAVDLALVVVQLWLRRRWPPAE